MERSGEIIQKRLGCSVKGDTLAGNTTGNGTNVNDMSGIPPAHASQERQAQLHHRFNIDL